MRRKPGLAGLQHKKAAKEKFSKVGTVLAAQRNEQMADQLSKFKANLEEFARKHKGKIRKNPEFRSQFQEMCTRIGVDPLASSKGFWAQILGVGDYYFELAVQIKDICMQTEPENGGLLDLKELKWRLVRLRGSASDRVSEDDIMRAIDKLKVLGRGFDLIKLSADKTLVASVPLEVNRDHEVVMGLAVKTGYTTISQIQRELGWTSERTHHQLHYLMQEGLAMLDNQGPEGEPLYWFISLSAHEEDNTGNTS